VNNDRGIGRMGEEVARIISLQKKYGKENQNHWRWEGRM
jgi:hypothetical protein